MDMKARAAVLAGGLVLVGMVAWVLMPSGTSEQAMDQDAAGDLALVPFDPATSSFDPFAEPVAAEPAAPAPTSLELPIPSNNLADTNAFSSGFGASPAWDNSTPSIPSTPANVSVSSGPSMPATSSDAWGRAFEQSPDESASSPAATSAFNSTFTSATVVTPSPAPAPAVTGTGTYRVLQGDSLYTISQKLYGSSKHTNAILAANPGLDPRRLRVGQTIKLPELSSAAPASSVTLASVNTATSSTSVAPTLGAPTSAKTYKVQSGDTLHKIARNTYGQTDAWQKIYAANKSAIGSDPSRLKVGTVLQLP